MFTVFEIVPCCLNMFCTKLEYTVVWANEGPDKTQTPYSMDWRLRHKMSWENIKMLYFRSVIEVGMGRVVGKLKEG